MYWHGMIEGPFCQDQGRAHLRVRRFIPTWRGRSRALPIWRGRSRALPMWRGWSRDLPCHPWVADFTQRGGVGEVEAAKGVESRGERGVESDADFPVKSRVSANVLRLHPEEVEWVKSVGEVGGLPPNMPVLATTATANMRVVPGAVRVGRFIRRRVK